MTYRVTIFQQGQEREHVLPAKTPIGARRLAVIKEYGRNAYLLPERSTKSEWLPDGAVEEVIGHVYRHLRGGQSGILDYHGMTITVYPAE